MVRLISRIHIAKERINKLKDRSTEIIQSETQSKKKKVKI